jgi:hypothetical protein
MEQQPPMSDEIVQQELEKHGARVRSRALRNDHYGAPRDFSFEVKAIFDNGLALQIIARQHNYRDPWETSGRIIDMVDISLLHQGQYSELPKGYSFFQGSDIEEEVDYPRFLEIIQTIKAINPKLFTLQMLTGDL